MSVARKGTKVTNVTNVPITDVSFYDEMKKAGTAARTAARNAADAVKKRLPKKAPSTMYEKPFVPGCCSDTLCSFHMANE